MKFMIPYLIRISSREKDELGEVDRGTEHVSLGAQGQRYVVSD